MSEKFELSLLGHPFVCRVRGEQRREIRFRLKKELEVLGFLALAADGRASKTEIASNVWRRSSAESIAKNFHPTLSSLRRDLGSSDSRLFELRHAVYVLDRSRFRCDVWSFEARAAKALERLRSGASGSSLNELLALWRGYKGELLRGYESAWIGHHRERLRHAYLRILRATAEQAILVSEYQLAIDAFRTILLEEPFEEGTHLKLMETYAAEGRRDLVRRHYVRYQDLLDRELSVEPSERTQRRYHELMR